MPLSESQAALIAENRAKALAILAAKKKEKEEYARLLSQAFLADAAGNAEAEKKDPEDGAMPCEPAAGSAEDPYLVEGPAVDFDTMDEGSEGGGADDDGDGQGDEDDDNGKSDENAAPKARGSYSTINSRHGFVQRFLASGMSETDFQEMNPTISVSTLEKWVSACDQVVMHIPFVIFYDSPKRAIRQLGLKSCK